MTETETPEFLAPLRDQLVRGAASRRRRRRRREVVAGSAVAAVVVFAATFAVVSANRDDLEVVTATQDDEVSSTLPAASITTVHDGVADPTEPSEAMWTPAVTTLAGASNPGVFWTGDRLLVVNTENGGTDVAGELWDPVTNTATPIAPSGLPWRVGAAMAWTGDELLVIGGGSDSGSGSGQPGAAYQPATDSWRPVSEPPAVSAEYAVFPSGPAMWSGNEVIIWGRGLAYRPADDSWRMLSRPSLSPRSRVVSVGTGAQVVVWGGCWVEGTQCDETNAGALGDGAVYDVATDTWTSLPPSPLTPAVHAVGVWDGDEVVIVVTEPGEGSTGVRTAAWSPTTGAWRVLPDPRLSDRRAAAAVLAGDDVVVWGGTGPADGAVLDGATQTWSTIDGPTPTMARSLHSMAWTGDVVYISSTLNVSPPLMLRPDAVVAPVEQVDPPPTRPSTVPDAIDAVPTLPPPPADLVIGADYYVDVDLVCESFELAGIWILDEGDPSTWQEPGERHEGGTFTLDAPDHGTFRGDAMSTKVATFSLLPEGDDPTCQPTPR